ncbi:hypothetical protein JCM9279_007006 [Rhodotorula babjevae]
MCTASSILFYGITVKAMDFALVAAAYKRSRPALLGIDLILARRARGRLEVENSVTTDVRALPVEMWDLVKRELVDLAYDDLYDKLEAIWLSNRDCVPLEPQRRLGGRCADLFGSDGGLNELINEGGVPRWVDSFTEQAQKFLSDFGLQLAMNDVISMSDNPWADLDSAWAVSLPFHLDKGHECERSAAKLDINPAMGISDTLLTT